MAAGMYWRKATPLGALLSMIAGTVTWIYFEWWPVAIPALVPALIASLTAMIAGSVWPVKRIYTFNYDQNRN
jgi:Na+/proline symporter